MSTIIHNDKTHWSKERPGKHLHANEVHIWRAGLDLDAFQLTGFSGVLSGDELERAMRFYFEKDANRFVAARGTLRHILAGYLGTNPKEIRFEYTSAGKPTLACHDDQGKLCFNLSHSGSYALFAIGLDRNLGIDLEQIRSDASVLEIALRFFSEQEVSSIMALHESSRPELFFQIWTRKEAFLKAIGKGISYPMKNIEVFQPGAALFYPIKVRGDDQVDDNWLGLDLVPGDGYAAAMAVEAIPGETGNNQPLVIMQKDFRFRNIS